MKKIGGFAGSLWCAFFEIQNYVYNVPPKKDLQTGPLTESGNANNAKKAFSIKRKRLLFYSDIIHSI